MSSNIFRNIFGKDDEDPFLEKVKELEEDMNENDKLMIINVAKLSNINVKEIMVPRGDIVGINEDFTLDDIVKVVETMKRTRLPIFNKNYDNVVGIVHIKDLLKCFVSPEKFSVEDVAREAYFVPETKPINDLLVEFREKKIHLGIVVDEYGGISGIVALEDIIEKIVGEIQDEFDNETDDIVKISDDEYVIKARTTLEELNDQIFTNLEDEEVDTLGGLVYRIFGRIPKINEKICHENYMFSVEAMTGRKIRTIRLEILREEDYEDEK